MSCINVKKERSTRSKQKAISGSISAESPQVKEESSGKLPSHKAQEVDVPILNICAKKERTINNGQKAMNSSTSTKSSQLKKEGSKNLSSQKAQGADESFLNAELLDLEKLVKDANIKETNRNIRKEYRKLITDLEKFHNIENNTTERLNGHILTANKLHKQVNGTFEATLDSKVLVIAADTGAKIAKKMRDETMTFDLELFKACVLNKLETEDVEDVGKTDIPVISKEKWNELNLITSQQIQSVGGIRLLMGPLSIQYMRRNRKSKCSNLDILGESITVSQIVGDKGTDTDNDTTANVFAIANILEQQGPINLFKFVINPLSYGQTVENIFFLSFLIKDGKAKIEIDDDNHPILTRSIPPTYEDYLNGLIKKQWIFDIEEATWKVMIKLFDLKNPIIPNRNYEPNIEDSNPSWK